MRTKAKSDATEAWYLRVLKSRLTYLVIASLLIIFEYLNDKLIQFPIIFVIPIMLASWFCAPHIGYSFAIGMAVVRLSFDFSWDNPDLFKYEIGNAVINVGVLLFISFITSQAARMTREVKLLQGILPTCCFCKKIQDKENKWHPIENYIENRTDANFSHGICPECAQRQYGSILNKTRDPKSSVPHF